MSTAGNRTKKKRSGVSRFLTIVLAGTVTVSAAANSYCIYDLFGRKIQSAQTAAEEKEEDEENAEIAEIEKAAKEEAQQQETETKARLTAGEVPYSPVMIDVVAAEAGSDNGDSQSVTVTDRDSAWNMLNIIGPAMGVKDVSSEYSFSYNLELGDYNYYVMKQSFNGIEVVGGELVMQADSVDGTLVNLGGRYRSVPSDLDTEITVSEDKVRETARMFAITNKGVTEDELYIDIRGQKIFPKNPSGYVSCYDVVCSTSIGYEFTLSIDGKTGNILNVYENVAMEMVTASLEGQKERHSLSVYRENDDLYYLMDHDRNISVHLNDRSNSPVQYGSLSGIDAYYYNPNDEDASKRTPDKSAVDALANLQKSYDFYQKNFDRRGVNPGSELRVYVGITELGYGAGSLMNFNNNAAMFGDKFMVVGTNSSDIEKSGRLDVIGHEFTHGIIANYPHGLASAGSGNEQTAINEGLADVFGELIEDYSNDGQLNMNPDWVHGTRDFVNPAESDYKTYDPAASEPHQFIGLTAGPFYKIVKAEHDAVPGKTAANLYYEIIPSLTAGTTVTGLRALIENSALKMNYNGTTSSAREDHTLTDKNVETIIDAFDAFGISSQTKSRVVQGGTLRVFDKDIKLYEKYNVKLYRPFDQKLTTPLLDRNAADSADFRLTDDIAPGYYTLVLTDLENTKNTESLLILINDNSAEQKVSEYPAVLNIFTKFGSEAKDVVLVLDSSGSMEGSPISQARASAKSFVQTVLDMNPASSISLISYDTSVNTRVTASNNRSALIASIEDIRDHGRTNIYDALDAAKKILEQSDSDKKLVVLLSDGLPNEGPSDGGDHYEPIYRLTDEMKSEDIIIYSLGFFHNLSGSDLRYGQEMMSKIATEGYDYVVNNADDIAGAASELELVFADFAEMFNGRKFINIRIACPVDVSVSFNGETLSSDPKNTVTRTSFGTLVFEKVIDELTGEETGDTVKVLRLDEDADYEICINGTGKGKMDYTISYPDEGGEYTDVRKFKRVPITKDTVVATSTKQEDAVELKVDTDGDGSFDLNYEAEKNKSAETTSGDSTLKLILILTNSLAGAAILAYLIVSLVKRGKARKEAAAPVLCTNCATPLAEGMKFCRNCGAPAPVRAAAAPAEPEARPSKAPVIIKLVLIGIFAAATIVPVNMYYSASATVFKQIRDGQPESARQIYNNSTSTSDGFISWLTNHHLDKAADAYSEGKLSEAEYRTLLEGVKAIGVDDASDIAKDKLKELTKSSSAAAGEEAPAAEDASQQQ